MRCLRFAALILFGVGSALAQDFPTKPIRFIVPSTPGSSVDIVGRVMAPEMAKILGQAIVVENRPGGANLIGFEYAANQVPKDGYILAVASTNSLAILPLTVREIRFDPFTLDELPHGKKIPPHDHGIWEALIVCSGQFTRTIYERTDDGKVPGHADLRAIEDRIYSPGEVALVVPPSDIHGFTALPGDPTFVMTIIGGQYTPTRHYYNVEAGTVVVRTPKALRESGALEVAS